MPQMMPIYWFMIYLFINLFVHFFLSFHYHKFFIFEKGFFKEEKSKEMFLLGSFLK